ncbi:MAG: hypothetical protein AAB692_03920 [Patescibacteria group bacterium]
MQEILRELTALFLFILAPATILSVVALLGFLFGCLLPAIVLLMLGALIWAAISWLAMHGTGGSFGRQAASVGSFFLFAGLVVGTVTQAIGGTETLIRFLGLEN